LEATYDKAGREYMQVFSRQTTDYIAEQFYLYFNRIKNKSQCMTIRDARDIVDYVSPSLRPTGSSSMDYSSPRVDGGGPKRPSEDHICRIVERLEDIPPWDDTFKTLLQKCEWEPDAEKIIYLTFRDCMGEVDICEALSISRATYFNYRSTILQRGAVIAYSKKIIDF